jgi:hypothetical protein
MKEEAQEGMRDEGGKHVADPPLFPLQGGDPREGASFENCYFLRRRNMVCA